MDNIISQQPSDQPLLKNPLYWCIGSALLTLVLLVLFRVFPQIEIELSRWFFTEKTCAAGVVDKLRCGYFSAVQSQSLSVVRKIGLRLPQFFAVALVLWLIWLAVFKPDKSSVDLMKPVHGLLAFGIGPGLLTNVIFKPFWGRPRPLQTVEFNGEAPYILAGDITDYCSGNCSFVSGEATAAFWMLWIVPLLSPRWRWPVGVLIFAVASGISLLRVAFGGHFLSDIVLGGMVAVFTIALSALILQTKIMQHLFERWCRFSNRHSFGSKK